MNTLSVASKRESPLLIELDRLEKQLEGLATSVARLDTQLDPALRPEAPSTPAGADIPGVMRSVVVNRLCNLTERVASIDRHVESLHDRSDV